MIHSRNDYGRIQDPAAEVPSTLEALTFARSVIQSGEQWTKKCDEVIGAAIEREQEKRLVGRDSTPIAVDEPVFLLRAKDKHFVAVLEYYMRKVGKDATMFESLELQVMRAEEWQKQNGTKKPDMPENLPNEILQLLADRAAGGE